MRTVRTLTPAEYPAYAAHLIRLGPDDRRLRFGGAVSDEAIAAAVDRLNPATSWVVAAFNDTLDVIAAVHVARIGWSTAECAFSVEEGWRRQGLGTLLMQRASLLARNRGVSRMLVFCVRENVAMRRLALRAGHALVVETDSIDGESALALASPVSLAEEAAAELAGVFGCASHAARLMARSLVPWQPQRATA